MNKRLLMTLDRETGAAMLHCFALYLYNEGPLPDSLLDVVKAIQETYPEMKKEFDFFTTGDAEEGLKKAPSCRCHGYN